MAEGDKITITLELQITGDRQAVHSEMEKFIEDIKELGQARGLEIK